jgi:hypothetical protein
MKKQNSKRNLQKTNIPSTPQKVRVFKSKQKSKSLNLSR